MRETSAQQKAAAGPAKEGLTLARCRLAGGSVRKSVQDRLRTAMESGNSAQSSPVEVTVSVVGEWVMDALRACPEMTPFDELLDQLQTAAAELCKESDQT